MGEHSEEGGAGLTGEMRGICSEQKDDMKGQDCGAPTFCETDFVVSTCVHHKRDGTRVRSVA